jgi:hypothetical protein
MNPRRVIAADSPARSPARSASSRTGSAPANPARRSSSTTNSSRSLMNYVGWKRCTYPGQFTIFDNRILPGQVHLATSIPRSRPVCRQP